MKELKIMKTTMIKVMGYRLWIIGMIALLPTLAAAVEYKSTYNGGYSQPAYGVAVTATAPSATFQSTSAYSEQWAAREEQSSINPDGTVNSSAYGIGRKPGLRKDPVAPPPNPGDPDDDPDDDGNVPLGDALLPLLLLALGYLVLRKRRAARP